MVVSDRPLIGLLERALAGDHGVLPICTRRWLPVFDPTRPAAWLPLAVPVVRRLASHEPLENQSDEEGLEVALRLARQIGRRARHLDGTYRSWLLWNGCSTD